VELRGLIDLLRGDLDRHLNHLVCVGLIAERDGTYAFGVPRKARRQAIESTVVLVYRKGESKPAGTFSTNGDLSQRGALVEDVPTAGRKCTKAPTPRLVAAQ
jgi:hypothetical protein